MEKTNRTKKLVLTAMLAAVAGVLMSFEFPLPLMPPFYKVDFSDVPTMIAVFLLGPASGACVEVLKILIKLFAKGTSTMYVGELANLIGVGIFVLPLWFVYKKGGFNFKSAVRAIIVTVPLRVVLSCFINAFITLPMYAAAMNLPLNDVVMMVSKANPLITNLPTFIILATIPFNLLKNGLNAIIGYFLYSRLIKISFIAQLQNLGKATITKIQGAAAN